MIPSHSAPDHVLCLQLGSTRERVYCFWLVRSCVRSTVRACIRKCKRSISITVYLMKFNMRRLMKHNVKKHHESDGEG